MASISPIKETKDGKRYFEIRVRMGREGQTLSSRWYVPEGKAWSEGTIKKKVDAAAQEFERQCKAGEVKTKKQVRADQEQKALEEAKIPTFENYANQVFMKALAVTCSENCRYNYQNALDHHITPILGPYKMPEITPTQISALLLKKQSEGLKVATCIKLYTIINSIFKKAYMEDLIDRNPMDKVSRPKATKAEGKDDAVKMYTEQEALDILKSIEGEPLKWKAMIYLLAYTGIRRGEATGLMWDCVDFREGSITLKRNLCYTPDKGIYVDTLKNGKTGKAYVPPTVMNMLRELKAEQQGNVIRMSKDWNGFVFTQDGTDLPMHPDSPTRYFKRLEKRYGIEDFHPHKLRHTLGSVLAAHGVDPVTISKQLRHKDAIMTMKWYIHPYEESLKQNAEIIGNVFAVNS